VRTPAPPSPDTLVDAQSSYETRWISATGLGRLIDRRGGADAELALWRAINVKLSLRNVVNERTRARVH
jgi:hypothetical protein